MKKIFTFSILFILVACNGAKKEAAEKVVRQFYKANSENNDSLMKELYVDFAEIRNRFKSNSIEILDRSVNSLGQVEIKVKNKFTNIKGVKFDQEIRLILEERPKDSGKFKIVDSYNVGDFSDDESYLFAVKTGFLKKKNSLSDMEISTILTKSDAFMLDEMKELYLDVVQKVKVKDWTWKLDDYSKTYVTGSGKIENKSSLSFPLVKGLITFYNAKDQLTKSLDYYLIFDTLYPGEEKEFNVYTTGVADANFAKIKLTMDEKLFKKTILEKKYSGKEASLFKQKNGSNAKK